MLSIWFQLTYHCVLEKNTQHQKPCCRKSVGIVPCNKELFKLSDLILCSVMPLNTEPNWCHGLVSILSHCYNYVYWVDSSTVSLCSCLVVCGHVMHPYGSDKDLCTFVAVLEPITDLIGEIWGFSICTFVKNQLPWFAFPLPVEWQWVVLARAWAGPSLDWGQSMPSPPISGYVLPTVANPWQTPCHSQTSMGCEPQLMCQRPDRKS